ncbi:carboxylating nicotinate-nucleotide diphosphorylase [candidate division KSB1 bacterium]|nr:carboxylating nicotinate-nucleotide diphosphorylase [candidate division KSB1 bacterium]
MNDLFKQPEITQLVKSALEEDLGSRGDITSKAINDDKTIQAEIIMKESGVLAGLDLARLVFEYDDESIEFKSLVSEGDFHSKGCAVARITGKVVSVLQAERTALNFLGRLSGIATQTFHFVRLINEFDTTILDTRKTTPGWRALEKYAVRTGGGQNHRMGLWDMFLIKDNHITAAGGIRLAVEKCRQYMKNQNFNAKIQVEACTLEMVQECLDQEIDVIMLDNMSIDEMRRAVERVDGKIPLEASGNMNMESLYDVAQIGVDYISVGALTHSARNLDLTMLLTENRN